MSPSTLKVPRFSLTPSRGFPGTLEAKAGEWAGEGSVFGVYADGQRCVLVPQSNVKTLIKRFRVLERKAEKLGMNAPRLAHVGEFAHSKRDEYGGHRWHRFAVYLLTSSPVHFNGWSFVAAIQHLAGDDGEYRNLVRSSPWYEGASVSPLVRSSRPVCEHCNTARKRNDTFVIEHDDGRRLQVGRQCLADYLGEADGSQILRYASFEQALRDLRDEADGWQSGGVDGWNVEQVLGVTVASIQTYGWTSRGKARDQGGGATADHVLQTLLALGSTDGAFQQELELRKLWDGAQGSSSDRPWDADAVEQTADAVVEWTEAIAEDTDNDYLWNLRVACSMGFVTWREMGIVCSAVSAWQRDQRQSEREEQRAVAAEVSAHIGAPGDKFGRKLSAADKRKGVESHPALGVTVTDTRLIEGDYGTSELVSMVDSEGNVLKWFATGHAKDTEKDRVTVGRSYSLVATIKGHGEYRGVSETKVNRCVLTPAQ